MGDEVCPHAVKNRTWFKHYCLDTDVGRCDWAGCARAGQLKIRIAELSFSPGRHSVLLGLGLSQWRAGVLSLSGQMERLEETR